MSHDARCEAAAVQGATARVPAVGLARVEGGRAVAALEDGNNAAPAADLSDLPDLPTGKSEREKERERDDAREKSRKREREVQKGGDQTHAMGTGIKAGTLEEPTTTGYRLQFLNLDQRTLVQACSSAWSSAAWLR